MALENQPCLLTVLGAVAIAAVLASSRVLDFSISVKFFMARDGFRTRQNIHTARGESSIFACAFKIRNSLTTSSAVCPPCFIVSSFLRNSSTSSSLAKFSRKFLIRSSCFGHTQESSACLMLLSI